MGYEKKETVTFINPPSPFLINDRVFVPLGILYVASVLKGKGYPVKFLDLSKTPYWQQMVANIDSRYVCTTGTTPHYSILKEISAIVRCTSPGSKLIVGGPHATIDPDSLAPYYDTIVLNEGEKIIEEALFTEEKIIQGGFVEDLDSIPYPDFDFIDLSSYRFIIDGKPAVHLVLTRGCPYKCGFCCKVNHKKLRFRNVVKVVEEIAYMKEKYGLVRYMFFDDTFTLKRKWVEEFCEKIKPLNIVWRCFTRANKADIDLLRLMKESGCAEIGVGVESGSQKILDTVDKKTRVEDNTRIRMLCKEVGIVFKAFIIVGLPGETEETFGETCNWLFENKPDKYSVFVFTPYPGSPIFDNPERYDFELTTAFEYEKLWWGGIMQDQISLSRTSALSSNRILDLRNNLLRDLKEAGLDDMNNLL